MLSPLRTALIESEVIVEEIRQQLPQNAGLEQLCLQQRAHSERRHAFAADARQIDKVLKKEVSTANIQGKNGR